MSWNLKAHRKYYESQHRTRGCKLTHMVGVPLILLSFPILLISWRAALKMFVGGWGLQFIGHFFFEKNRPVFWTEGNRLMTVCAAIIFVYESWVRLLTGQPLADEEPHEEEIENQTEPESEKEPVVPEVIELKMRVQRRRQAL